MMFNNPGLVEFHTDERGFKHREDGPAVVYANGTEIWYLHGKLHREDGPALTRPDGHKAWYRNGVLHREDGPAIILSIAENGPNAFYLNGRFITNCPVEWFTMGHFISKDKDE